MIRHEFDVVIVGAGPGGIAAACEVAAAGKRVAIVDANHAPGGQIWRGHRHTHHSEAFAWFDKLDQSAVTRLQGHTVIAAPKPGTLIAETSENQVEINHGKLILATGAQELFMPYPGWTLPGVMGCGGLEALVKAGFDVRGKRIVVAGSGPLPMAVAAQLNKYAGAIVPLLLEQTPYLRVVQFGMHLLTTPAKLKMAMAFQWQLRKTRTRYSSWITSITKDAAGLQVNYLDHGKPRTETCDYVACAYGLVPSTDLPRLLGCSIEPGGFVVVDALQQTSLANVFAAGELTGIGGMEKAVVEGQIAGLMAVGLVEQAHALTAKRERYLEFARRLRDTFELRDDIRKLARNDTIVCRCEDVKWVELKDCVSSRDAKLQTRCGMGPCQGRICGPILREKRGWTDASVRPPVMAARMGSLLDASLLDGQKSE